MRLSSVRLSQVGPHGALALSLAEPGGEPRRLTLLFGASGVGKTAILSAIASTRPGLATALPPPRLSLAEEIPAPSFAVTEWVLGQDDPARPHPLVVASPSAAPAALGEREEVTLLRRREQALFDRRAAAGGFTFVAISGARWFSRTPVALSSPERTILRHDARAASSFDDPGRADLSREVKQVLTFAFLAASLARGQAAEKGEPASRPGHRALEPALRSALGAVLRPLGLTFAGCGPEQLEPEFEDESGARISFDDLPRPAKHLAAFVTLPLRAAAASQPERDPRQAEIVVLLDDADLHLPPALQGELPGLLAEALPAAQWVLASSSPALALACEAPSLVALRREGVSGQVEIRHGLAAVLH